VRLAERDVLAAREELSDPLGNDAADQDHDKTSQEEANRKWTQGKLKLLYAVCNAKVYEQLGGIRVREKPRDRMHEGYCRVIESRLVLFFQEHAECAGHWVREEEDRKQGEERIAGDDVARREAGKPMDPLLPDQFDNGVDRGQKHDQGRQDTGDETDERLATGLEDADEVFRPV